MAETINTLFIRNAGFILLLFSSLFSWVLVIYRYIFKIDETKVKTEYILKGHIDFFLIGIMLLLFSLLCSIINPIFTLLAIIGAFSNPTMFIIVAFKPTINKSPKKVYLI